MKSDLTVVELIAWMREWIANDVSITVSEVNPDKPFEEFGLSSRSILELTGQLEDLTGKSINAAVIYQNPTVNKLAVFLLDDSDPAAETFHKSRDRSTVEGADIAIIGIATRFPGDANTPEEYWTLLHDGVDAVTDLPDTRYQEFLEDKEVAAKLDAAPTRGGYIKPEYIRYFDPEFFSIAPREAEQVDSQQRMLLELTYEVFEDAHLPISEQRGHRVCVFVGASSQDYARILESDYSAFHPYSLTGLSPAILSNRISYTFDFRGPSISMDTACSSSLVAVHQAVQALRRGESSLAVAGGINLILAPGTQLAFADLETVLSSDGYIKAFSNDADGISRSDGAGLVLLKRLQDAEADGDHIYAVIKGSAVNQDGRSNGITAPNPDAQMEVLADAYQDANIAPQDVDYVEAHGTGTILGDPIEALALGKVLGYGRDAEKPLLLGSCKTNFGHMESAAGSASLIKLALAMDKGVIPPMLHFAGPNPYIDFEGDHLEPVTELREWPRYSGKAVAGVSGFGFGGTNAHVVVEEYTGPAAGSADTAGLADAADSAATPELSEEERTQLEAENAMFEDVEEPATYVLPISGTLSTRARQSAKHVADWLEDNPDVDLAAVAHTLATRSIGRFRNEVIATDMDSARAGLLAVAEGTESPNVYSGHHTALEGPVWVYSGFGGQHRKMGKRLYLADKFRGDFGGIFAASFDNVAKLIQEESDKDIRQIMLDDALNWDTETAQDGIFAIQVALTDTLTYFGCQPAAVIGHSMGEVAAAYAAGGLSLDDAVRVICVRSRLLGEGEANLSAEEQGGMALVEYSADEIAQLVAENPGKFDTVEPAVYAAPTQITVGGRKIDVKAFVDYATEHGKFARMLPVNGAGHTSMVAPLIGELIGEIADIEPRPLRCTLFSSIDKDAVYRAGDTPTDYKYFAKGMRHSVWFTQAVTQACQAGHTCFMEVSAHPVAILSVAAATYAAKIPNAKLFYTLRRKEYEPNTLVRAIAQLAADGHPTNLRNLALTRDYADVPRTGFQRKYCWTSSRLSGSNDSHLPGAHVLLPTGQHVWNVQKKAVKTPEMLALAAADYCYGQDAVVTAWEILGQDASDSAAGDGHYVTMLEEQGAATTAAVTSDAAAQDADAAVKTATVEIFAQQNNESVKLAVATITVGDPSAEPAIVAEQRSQDELDSEDFLAENNTDNDYYDPTTGETILERLTKIVATNLAYNPEDLTSELPLMQLGLDSLMAIRIKNRIQYEFQIPELDLMVVRSSTIGDVAEYITNVREAQVQGLSAEEASQVSAQKLAEKRSGTQTGAQTGADSADAAATAGANAGAGAAHAADSAETNVPPRDASERLAFSTWATVTGESAGDVLHPLPQIGDDTRAKLAERLAERTGSDIDPTLLSDVKNIEQLANIIRPFLEKEVEGLVRTLRDFPTEQHAKALFLFHPAGGTTAQYSALVDDLPKDLPVFGLERVEGPLEERAAAYLPAIKEIQPEGPYTLGGWSLGGALAYEVAKQLIAAGDEVASILLIDTVQASEPDPGTREELHARWDRYGAFIKKTYGLDFQVPHEMLDAQGEEGMMKLFAQMATNPNLARAGVSAAVLEHQRASFVDNRMLASIDMSKWASVQVPVTLYRAERMHDGAIELEPRYAHIDPDGGWGKIVKDLTVVHLKGDHLSVIDEPEVGKIARDIIKRRTNLGL